MVIELAILGGEHRALHIEGYVGERDTAPRGVAEAPDLGGAVGVVDDRRLRARDLIGVGHGGEEDRSSEGPGAKEAENEQGEEGAADPAALATRLPVRSGSAAPPGLGLRRALGVPAASHGAPPRWAPAIGGLP